jgi:uncharacterized membrane protein YdbT with pleckstrin-like domain
MNKDVDLKTLFPVSVRWILKNISILVIGLFCILYCLYLFEFTFDPLVINNIYRNVFYFGSFVIIVRTIYLFIFVKYLEYKIVGDEIVISKGIIIKKPIGIPLGKINAIQIKRKFHDFLFGLSSVVIIVPGNEDIALATISGFSKNKALELKAYILKVN